MVKKYDMGLNKNLDSSWSEGARGAGPDAFDYESFGYISFFPTWCSYCYCCSICPMS